MARFSALVRDYPSRSLASRHRKSESKDSALAIAITNETRECKIDYFQTHRLYTRARNFTLNRIRCGVYLLHSRFMYCVCLQSGREVALRALRCIEFSTNISAAFVSVPRPPLRAPALSVFLVGFMCSFLLRFAASFFFCFVLGAVSSHALSAKSTNIILVSDVRLSLPPSPRLFGFGVSVARFRPAREPSTVRRITISTANFQLIRAACISTSRSLSLRLAYRSSAPAAPPATRQRTQKHFCG